MTQHSIVSARFKKNGANRIDGAATVAAATSTFLRSGTKVESTAVCETADDSILEHDFGSAKIAIIGLGYIGTPLAVAFGRCRAVIGFDVSQRRVHELRLGRDTTREVIEADFQAASHLRFTSTAADLSDCKIFIIAVPTPTDAANRPDMTILEAATASVGRVMPKGAVVIYESTVYPGCTRNVCVPILEKESGYAFNTDFFVGYSPERINPGDKARRLETIVKVTSGSTPEIADVVDELYRSIVTAGTHKATSIEVAEAAKVIENTQRDLNIALMNELAIIFNKLGLDTKEVLEAARTKWNFLPFSPGLVGGHCIGVDPYYLTHRAQEVGYHPEVILAGRRINDEMGVYVADRVARMMMRAGLPVVGSKILVLGLTFKEDCPDIRNSKVADVIVALRDYCADVDIHDPWADHSEAQAEYGFTLLPELPDASDYDTIVIAVAHAAYKRLGSAQIHALGKPNALVFDVKGMLEKNESDGRL